MQHRQKLVLTLLIDQILIYYKTMSSESSHNSLLMKKSNEIKLNTLVASFAKAEPNHLRFSELLYMLLDRCIFINRLSFKKFAELFDDATKITTKLQKK
jgi:hypothetical protein